MTDFKREYLDKLDTFTTEEWHNLMVALHLRIVTRPQVMPEMSPEYIKILSIKKLT